VRSRGHGLRVERAYRGRVARARRVRIGLLLAALVLAAGWLLADRRGLLGRFVGAPGALDERLDVGHGVVVERVRLLRPPCQLMVARVPRRAGLRLRAVRLATGAAPALRPLSAVADLGALVAVNGDYHHLDGPYAGLPESTLLPGDGSAVTIGAATDRACAFYVGDDGAPGVGALSLGAKLCWSTGGELPVRVDVSSGEEARLRLLPPAGRWSEERLGGVPVTFERDRLRVSGPWTEGPFDGPALLVPEEAGLAPGETATLVRTGGDATTALAIGTGPRLLRAGQVAGEIARAPFERFARTAVGLGPDEVILATTLQAPHQGLSVDQLARALLALGCTDAVNLDGGPSTALWAAGRLRNVADDEDGESFAPEDVATALVILPPGAAGAELR
jgi:hypothetical protein